MINFMANAGEFKKKKKLDVKNAHKDTSTYHLW